MKERLEKILDQGFRDLQKRLLDRIEASLEPVEVWLRAEQEAEQQQSGTRDPYLDESVLSRLLQGVKKRSRLSRAEWKRIREVKKRIGEFRSQIKKNAPKPRLLQDQDNPQKILGAAEAHYRFYSGLFRDLRILDMELTGAYDPVVHDPVMAGFSWKDLTDREMALVPPVVAVFDADRSFVENSALVLDLFAASLPVKLLALQRHVGSGKIESGRAVEHQFHPDLGFFGLSLRSAFVLQATESIGESFDQEVMAALKSPRPALISIWESPLNNPEESWLALASRTFPYLRYDPDLGLDCRACLSIDKNPQAGEPWVHEILPLPGGGEEELPLTFAEFAWQVAGLKDQFEPLAESAVENPTLAEYLTMDAAERHQLRPYILVIDQGEPLALVPSHNILCQCRDKLRLWHYLQSLAGIRTPCDEEAAGPPAAEQKPREQADRKDPGTRILEEREKAVAEAMQTLSMKLLGFKEMGIPGVGGEEFPLDLALPTQVAIPTETVTEDVPAAGAVGEFWIETKLCTACDECTRINKRIFVYNKDKQAVIKNPRGGPFRDIVKAAEKCSAEIIHPGKPLDLNEKDLAKWIKRAEKYQ